MGRNFSLYVKDEDLQWFEAIESEGNLSEAICSRLRPECEKAYKILVGFSWAASVLERDAQAGKQPRDKSDVVRLVGTPPSGWIEAVRGACFSPLASEIRIGGEWNELPTFETALPVLREAAETRRKEKEELDAAAAKEVERGAKETAAKEAAAKKLEEDRTAERKALRAIIDPAGKAALLESMNLPWIDEARIEVVRRIAGEIGKGKEKILPGDEGYRHMKNAPTASDAKIASEFSIGDLAAYRAIETEAEAAFAATCGEISTLHCEVSADIIDDENCVWVRVYSDVFEGSEYIFIVL